MELLVGLPNLVVGTLKDRNLSVVLTDTSLKLMNIGFWVKTTLLPEFIPQRKFTSSMESTENLKPTTLLKMGLIPLSSEKPINRSFDFLGVPDLLRTNGPYWIDNNLVPIPDLGSSGTMTNLKWGSRPGRRYDGVSVPWHGAVADCLAYLPRISENTRATARRVNDDLL